MTREEIMKRCKELDPIWQAMKEGEKFKLWDDKEDVFTEYLTGIDVEDLSTFRTKAGCFVHAEPIELDYRVKDPVSLMKALVDGGYKCDRGGDWVHPNLDTTCFKSQMFQYCGKLVSENNYTWLSEWLEEVSE